MPTEGVVDVLLYLAGALALAALCLRCEPRLTRPVAVALVALAGLFFGRALATDAHQMPTDILRATLPWGDPEPVANALLQDPATQFLPWRHLVRERLLRLEMPLWSHELGCGSPLIGNAQSAPFYPYNLATLPLPPLRAMTLAMAWTILTAMFGAAAVTARLGAGALGTTFAGIAFGFSTFLISWAAHPHSNVAAWLPAIVWSLLALASASAGPGRRARAMVALAGTSTCAVLGGHPGTILQVALAGAIVALWLFARAGVGRWRFAGGVLCGAALAMCLTAPAWIPVAEALPESERAATTGRRGVAAVPFEPRRLALALVPYADGTPLDGSWRGPQNFQESATASAGFASPVLALAGLGLGAGPAAAVVGGSAALLTAAGVPGLAQLGRAPALAVSHPARLHWIFGLATAIAGGLGLDRALSDRRLGRRVGLALVGLALIAALVGVPGSVQPQIWLAVVGGGSVLVGLLLLFGRPSFAGWLVLSVLVFDLGWFGVRYHPTLPATARPTSNPLLAALDGELATAPAGSRILAEGVDFPAAAPALFGYWDTRANDPMRSRLLDVFLRTELTFDAPWRRHRLGFGPIDRSKQSALDLLAARYAILPHGRKPPGPWQRVAVTEEGRLWRNPWALPLFRITPEVRVLTSAGPVAQAREAARTVDFARLTALAAGEPGLQSGTVIGVTVVSNGFDLTVDAPAGTVIGSSVSWARAWRAYGPGGPAQTLVVDGAFLGVVVPADGTQNLELRYRPRGFSFALVAAGLALLTLAWLGLPGRL